MAFLVTIYRNNNPEILCTTFTGTQDGNEVSNDLYYASGSAPYGIELEGEVEFEALPAEGYSFTRWVYRIGSTTATQQTSTRNPFTYDGEEDIYIRAEGEEDESGGGGTTESWTAEAHGSGTQLTSETHFPLTLEPYTLHRIQFVCKYSGTVTLYAESDLDTVGYLSRSTFFDDEAGEPNTILESDDDSGSGDNFQFTYTVTAGETYYLWVRGYGEEEEGDVDVYIVPPEPGTATGGGGLYIFSMAQSRWVKVTPYIFDGSEWIPAQANLFVSGRGWIADDS